MHVDKTDAWSPVASLSFVGLITMHQDVTLWIMNFIGRLLLETCAQIVSFLNIIKNFDQKLVEKSCFLGSFVSCTLSMQLIVASTLFKIFAHNDCV